MEKEVMELNSETEVTTIQLQEEIKECKAILKCGVCFDRPKEVMCDIMVRLISQVLHDHFSYLLWQVLYISHMFWLPNVKDRRQWLEESD